MPRIPSQQRSSTRASRQPQTGPHRSQNRPPRPQDQRPVLICRVKDEQEAILVAQAAAEGRIPLAPRVPGKTARVEHGLVVVMEDPNPDKKRRYTDSGDWSYSRSGGPKATMNRYRRLILAEKISPAIKQEWANTKEPAKLVGDLKLGKRVLKTRIIKGKKVEVEYVCCGLIKQTWTVQYNDMTYRVIWYYEPLHVKDLLDVSTALDLLSLPLQVFPVAIPCLETSLGVSQGGEAPSFSADAVAGPSARSASLTPSRFPSPLPEPPTAPVATSLDGALFHSESSLSGFMGISPFGIEDCNPQMGSMLTGLDAVAGLAPATSQTDPSSYHLPRELESATRKPIKLEDPWVGIPSNVFLPPMAAHLEDAFTSTSIYPHPSIDGSSLYPTIAPSQLHSRYGEELASQAIHPAAPSQFLEVEFARWFNF